MLDPEGRKELLNCIKDFRDKNHTIILITQNTEDIVDADEIFVLDNHQIAAFGKPREILSNIDLLIHADIQVPFPVRVYHDLQTNGISLPYCPLCNEELAEAVCSLS
jgi:energy-coupling factor transport system ATP-binding protein